MAIEAYITVGVIVVAITLFSTDRFAPDLVAVSAMVVLTLTGVITPSEALSGFANNATVTVAAMFVLSVAVLKTGIIEAIGPVVSRRLRRRFSATSATMMATVGAISAFVNNTPVVATFVPIVSESARRARIAPSRVLIPLSYGAIFGGTCTLIGTSTNLLVSGIAERNGHAGFSMFTLAPFGFVVFVVGVVYMLVFGNRLLPERASGDDLAEDFDIDDFMTEIAIPEGSGVSGSTIEDAFGRNETPIEVLQLLRDDNLVEEPRADFVLAEGDRLAVRGDVERVARILDTRDFDVADRIQADRLRGADKVLLEVMLTANSDLDGESLRSHRFAERYNASVLAIRRSGRLRHKKLWDTHLRSGDVLLLHTTRRAQRRIRALEARHAAPFITINEHGVRRFEPRRFAAVLGVIVAVVGAAAVGLAPIGIAAISGIALLAFAGILTMRNVYRSVDWQVVFLLAAALSFGDAMTNSGLTAMLSNALIESVGSAWGPVAVLAAIYLLTSVMTEVMSNNAAAALLAPIALTAAEAMNVDPLPLLLAVAFAGSASFMTPVGYQTNTMVYSAGNYRFGDFVRVGAPLNLLLWMLASLLLPVLYPF